MLACCFIHLVQDLGKQQTERLPDAAAHRPLMQPGHTWPPGPWISHMVSTKLPSSSPCSRPEVPSAKELGWTLDFPLGRYLASGHPDHRHRCTCLLPLTVETEAGRGRPTAQGLRNFEEMHVALKPGSPGQSMMPCEEASVFTFVKWCQ